MLIFFGLNCRSLRESLQNKVCLQKIVDLEEKNEVEGGKEIEFRKTSKKEKREYSMYWRSFFNLAFKKVTFSKLISNSVALANSFNLVFGICSHLDLEVFILVFKLLRDKPLSS